MHGSVPSPSVAGGGSGVAELKNKGNLQSWPKPVVVKQVTVTLTSPVTGLTYTTVGIITNPVKRGRR